MRAFFFVPAVLVAACSGSSSSGLFAPAPDCDAGCTDVRPTEPALPDASEAPPPAASRDGGAPDVAAGAPCNRDSECTDTNLCNLELDRCAAPGGLDAPCLRDRECAGNLCNLELDRCADKEPASGPCLRDVECATALCNLQLDQCDAPEPAGGPCLRDRECATRHCNTAIDACE